MRRPATIPKLIMQTHPESPMSDVYRSLWFNLECTAFHSGVRAITMTSAAEGEGKTTVAIQTAIASAQAGKRVILVDANLRAPILHRSFGKDNRNGLSNFLGREMTLAEIVEPSGVENLSLITSGPVPSSPIQALLNGQWHVLINELKDRFEIVIVDTPPLLSATDSRIISSACDGVLLVVKHGKLKQASAKKISEDLIRMRANVIGVVYNQVSKAAAKAYFS